MEKKTQRFNGTSLFDLFKNIGQVKGVYMIGMVDKTDKGYTAPVWIKQPITPVNK